MAYPFKAHAALFCSKALQVAVGVLAYFSVMLSCNLVLAIISHPFLVRAIEPSFGPFGFWRLFHLLNFIGVVWWLPLCVALSILYENLISRCALYPPKDS
jgi:hypothetical protein